MTKGSHNMGRTWGSAALNASKTECPQGHPYDEANTLMDRRGWRHCRTCNASTCRAAYQKRKVLKGIPPGRIPRPPEERFWAKVEKTEDCWLWTAGKDQKGYGLFRIGSLAIGTSRLVRAHRWAYERAHGAVPDGHDLHHVCGVPACVNPGHLESLTPGDHKRLHVEEKTA